MTVREEEVLRTLEVAFFLEDLFSSQKRRSKPKNKAVSHAIPSVFHGVFLVRPGQWVSETPRQPLYKRISPPRRQKALSSQQ